MPHRFDLPRPLQQSFRTACFQHSQALEILALQMKICPNVQASLQSLPDSDRSNMKAFVFHGQRDVRVEDVPAPHCTAQHVRVRRWLTIPPLYHEAHACL